MKIRACLMVAVMAGCAGVALAADDSNWAATLGQGAEAGGAGDDGAKGDIGVVGMSSEELASLATASQQSEVDDEVPDNFVHNRRRFVMREMKFNSDWDTDPTSLPAMIDQFKRRTNMDAQALLPRKPLTFDDPELLDWPFVFMTAHNAFTLNEKEVANLKKYLDRGGFLFSDDCLYGFPFGPAMHGEMAKVYADKELKAINPADPVLGLILKQKYSWSVVNEVGLPTILKANAFQALVVDGHIAVYYTPPDLGCMWEISSPPTPSNPLGAGMHNMDDFPGMREAGYRMGINAIFYAFTH